MFAPPGCRRRWRHTLFVPPGPTKTAATERTSQRVGRAIKQAMFAPPGCRRRWRHNAFPFRQVRRRRRRQSGHRSERGEQSNRRCSRRRAAGGDGGTTLFRSARSDEDGGDRADIAASGASNQTGDVRAAGLQEEMAAQRFSVPPGPQSDEDGGDRADIAASGASNQTAPVFSSTTSNSLTMRLAISKEAVAAGDGAFSTCTWRGARW